MWGIGNWSRKTNRPMFGIDISHHQGNVDFNKLVFNNPHIDFIFLKATQGTTYTDPKFYTNVLGCEKAKISWGAYHFATLNEHNVRQDAESEANFFLSVIKKATSPQLPLVLDIEISDPKVQLDTFEVLNFIKTFFATLEASGYNNYMIYSGTPFLDSHLPKEHGLGTIPLWIAAYTSRPVPKLPHGWNEYKIWQYSDKGNVSGINGFCDLNKSPAALYS